MTDNQPHSWIVQIKGGTNLMSNIINALELARIECSALSSRRPQLDALLEGCRNAKRIGTGGTDGTDAK